MIRFALEKEYCDLYYRFRVKKYFGVFLVIGVLYFVFFDYIAPVVLNSWLVLIIALTIAQLALVLKYFKSDIKTIADCNRWINYANVGSLLVSLCIGGITSFGGRLPVTEWLFIEITLAASVSVFSACGFKKFVVGYAFSILSAVAIANQQHFEAYWHVSTILTVLAFIIFYAMSSYFEKTLRDSIRIRYENTELLQELKIKKEEADLANDAKSKFLAAASHDLRQPLHALGMYMDSLKDLLTTKKQTALGNKVDLSLNALNSLFDSLLDISKLDSETIKPVFDNFNVKGLLMRILDNFEESATSKDIKLILENGSEVIQSDKILLERIISNIISNAIRYTKEGKVTITTRTKNNDVIITVRDTGIGIPSEELEKIFIEFYQLDNPERNQTKGIGLGLAIVKRLVDLLDHEMNFTSQVNIGTSVELKIPKGKINTSQRKADSDQVYDIAGLKILFLDDNEAILDSMKLLFERWGCEAFTYSNIETAIEHSKNNPTPNIIISDNSLENSITGSQAIELLNNEFEEPIPAILVTGDTSSERIYDATQKGYELLHKPVNPGLLKKRIAILTVSRFLSSTDSK